MDGSLPTSLKHIISNAEYYGPSLFLLGKFVVAHHKIVLGSTNTFFHIELLQGKKINIIKFTTNLMCCLLFSELSACLLVCLFAFFNLIFSPVFDLHSDGGGDSVCVPGAITAFLPAGQWPH